jgi:ribose 5-phosphate isomerase B
MFNLEILKKMSDEKIQKILKSKTLEEIVVLMHFVDSNIRDKFFKNMSKNASEKIEERLAILGDIKFPEAEKILKSVVDFAGSLTSKKNIKIALASDHAGYDLKEAIKPFLTDYEVIDFGTNSTDSMDYPDTGFKAAEAVSKGECEKGIIICGSGIGMSIVANKVKNIRAALCHCTDFSKLSRMHNDANVLVMPGRFVSKYLAKDIIDIFFKTKFEGGRHQRRIDKISNYENKN